MKKVIISVIILIVLALLAVLGIRLVNEGSPRSSFESTPLTSFEEAKEQKPRFY